MIAAAAALLVLFCGPVLAAPIRISSCDLVGPDTGNASDSLEFTELLTGGAGDADARLQTTTIHSGVNGGTDVSVFAGRFEGTASGRSAAYKWKPDFNPSDTSYAMSASFHLATAPASTLRRTIFAMRESSDTDLGCAVVVDSNRALTLTYIGTDTTSCASDAGCSGTEWCYGGFCRPKWGTTAGNTLTVASCSTDRRIACTVNGDCPSSGICNQTYWAGIELNQISQGTNVICELYVNGRAILTGTPLDPPGTPVGGVTNALWGVLAAGETTALPVVYVDDPVMDDSGIRAGYGYVFRKVPSADGTQSNRWGVTSACGSKFQCVDDYVVGSFVYDSGIISNNSLGATGPSKVQDMLFATPVLTPALQGGETVTAVEVVVAGAAAATGIGREIAVGILTCPGLVESACQPQESAVVSAEICRDSLCVHDSSTVCAVNADCGGNGELRILHRYLRPTAPIVGATAWVGHLNELGVRLNSAATAASRTLYVGAVLLYGFVRKPDLGDALTLRDHNKGADDGLVTICAIGDSTGGGTLETTCQAPATNEGEFCSFSKYCSYAPIEKDQPPGGCTNDAMCKRCTGNKSIVCTDDTQCQLGTCGGSPGTCSGDADTSCTTTCDFGTCDLAATCIESCPGGTCPTDRAGWPAPLITLQPNVLLNCSFGAEDSGQMYTNRFAKILDGEGSAITACGALLGTGSCTVGGAICSTGADCTSGGFCQFPKCDYVVLLEGYNDQFQYAFLEVGGSYKLAHDPECETAEGYVSGRGGSLTTPAGVPTKHCPQFGASGYARPLMACGRQADCAGISGTSDCYGVCTASATATHCATTAGECQTCSVFSPPCHTNANCSSGICSVNHTSTIGAIFPGICLCTSDAMCGSAYHCVGEPGGKKVCRRRSTAGTSDCTADADCGAFSTCDTSTCDTAGRCDSATHNFCQGRCTVPCNAITCDGDEDCGRTIVTGRWGGLRTRTIAGSCNNALGKCACCGTVRCTEHPELMRKGCSCTPATEVADCGTGGDCDPNYGVCIAGDAARRDCIANSQCASGRECMRCSEQARRWQSHHGLLRDVVSRMAADIAALGEATPPLLIASELPLVNGRTGTTNVIADRACTGAWSDRAYYTRTKKDFLAVLPATRVVDQSGFNDDRMRLAYHTDQVHFSPTGAARAGEAVAATFQKYNVCQTGAGVVQTYCKNANGTYEATICTTNADCNIDETCSRRFCVNTDGTPNQTNCPHAGDTCVGE